MKDQPPQGGQRVDVVTPGLPFILEKPFLAFCGAHYYPNGGWGDVVDYFDTVEDALAALLNSRLETDWWHIVDIRTGQIVRKREMSQ